MSSITYYNPNDEFCLEVRQWFLDNPQDDSNVESIGDSSGPINSFYGKKHTPEVRKLMSYAAKNRTEEHRNKLSEARKGKTHTPEARKKMSEAGKGKPKSEETKKRMCIAFKDRKLPPQTEEQKRKNSEAHKGEKNHFYGKTHTEESKRKMSETTSKMQKGKKRGPYKKRNTI